MRGSSTPEQVDPEVDEDDERRDDKDERLTTDVAPDGDRIRGRRRGCRKGS
jgi:hypothetical protein